MKSLGEVSVWDFQRGCHSLGFCGVLGVIVMDVVGFLWGVFVLGGVEVM